MVFTCGFFPNVVLACKSEHLEKESLLEAIPFYDLVLEVSQLHFWYILLVVELLRLTPIQGEGN